MSYSELFIFVYFNYWLQSLIKKMTANRKEGNIKSLGKTFLPPNSL